jgi:hypothetical protein
MGNLSETTTKNRRQPMRFSENTPEGRSVANLRPSRHNSNESDGNTTSRNEPTHNPPGNLDLVI